MKYKTKVTTDFEKDSILVEAGLFNGFDELVSMGIRQTIALRDEQTREALIKMGWTPPDKKLKCPYCSMEYKAIEGLT